MPYQAARGTRDFIPPEGDRAAGVEAAARGVFRRFGYEEVRTPVFEAAELYQRSTGASSDIVRKEMYTFQDRKGRQLALRPEGTPGVVRAALENSLLSGGSELRLFYIGPMFRYERPQKGRYRQHTQMGVEYFGCDSPSSDAEVIVLAVSLLQDLGIAGGRVLLNSLGCPDCRPAYGQALRDFFGGRTDLLCEDCRRRVEENPLRLLDCKEDACREIARTAPDLSGFRCQACRAHLAAVRDLLSAADVPVSEEPRLVRGLDYYTRTVFEVTHESLGAQNALLGGGRYDTLVGELGGPPTPAVGFAVGLERVLEIAPGAGAPGARMDVYLAPLGTAARREAFVLADRLRKKEIKVILPGAERSLKSHLRAAGKTGARLALILGEEELSRGVVVSKDMGNYNENSTSGAEKGPRNRSGPPQQEEIPLADAVDRIQSLLKQPVEKSRNTLKLPGFPLSRE